MLFVSPRISRIDFYRFIQVIQRVLEPLIGGVGKCTLLISNRQVLREFSIDLSGFAKTLDRFIPILILGSLCSLPGNFRRFRTSLLLADFAIESPSVVTRQTTNSVFMVSDY